MVFQQVAFLTPLKSTVYSHTTYLKSFVQQQIKQPLAFIMFNPFKGAEVDPKSPEAKYLRLVERFKSTLAEELRVVESLGDDKLSRFTAVAGRLDGLADQVTGIEKASLDMAKRTPKCGTVSNKPGFFGTKSIFLMMTQALRNEIHALKKVIQKNAGTFHRSKAIGIEVARLVKRLGEVSYATFDGDPVRDHKEEPEDEGPPQTGRKRRQAPRQAPRQALPGASHQASENRGQRPRERRA